MGSEGRALQDQVNGFAGRVEVIEGPSGRRSWPDDVKARIVREKFLSLGPRSARWRAGIGYRRSI